MSDERDQKETEILMGVILKHPSLESEVEDIIQFYKLGTIEGTYNGQTSLGEILSDYRHKAYSYEIEIPQKDKITFMVENSTVEELLTAFNANERYVLMFYYYFGYDQNEVIRITKMTDQDFLMSIRKIKEVFIDLIIPGL